LVVQAHERKTRELPSDVTNAVAWYGSIWDKTANRHRVLERPIPSKPAVREAAKMALAKPANGRERRSIFNLKADRHSSGDHCGHWRMIMETPETETTATKRQVWNAGRTVGAKRVLKPKQIWEIQFYLTERRRLRDRALFDLAIDSKLRGCDLVQMKIGDILSGGQI